MRERGGTANPEHVEQLLYRTLLYETASKIKEHNYVKYQ